MKILSVETSSIVCSVAILEDNKVLYENSIDNALSHSENLMPMIKKAFDETNLTLADIDLFACSKGPGSFTGIRIGISTIKAFVDVYNKPSFGISSLEGLAYNVENSKYVCSIINAKNNNAYAALYENKNGIYELKLDYLSTDITSIINKLNSFINEDITFVGDGSIEFNTLLKTAFKNANFAQNNANKCNAVSIGIAAFNHNNANLNFDNSLSPMYLKKSQAERQLEEGKLK